MDCSPHIHTIEVHRRWRSLDEGGWYVTYGDTTLPVTRWQPNRFGKDVRRPKLRKIHRAVAKAIRQHDEGSIKAGRPEGPLDLPVLLPDSWGSEQLR